MHAVATNDREKILYLMADDTNYSASNIENVASSGWQGGPYDFLNSRVAARRKTAESCCVHSTSN